MPSAKLIVWIAGVSLLTSLALDKYRKQAR